MKRGYFCTLANNGWRYMLASVLWPKLESAPNTVETKKPPSVLQYYTNDASLASAFAALAPRLYTF